eukprot:1409805-Amphidinium_carterae.1
MMPETLARQEALHLFRLALLALQAALVSQHAEGLAPWTVPAPKAPPPRPAGSLHDLTRASRSSPLGPSATADFVRTSRGYSKPDDTAMSSVNQRPAGRLPEPKFVLASRQDRTRGVTRGWKCHPKSEQSELESFYSWQNNATHKHISFNHAVFLKVCNELTRVLKGQRRQQRQNM